MVKSSAHMIHETEPEPKGPSELMYKAHIILDWPSTDPTELHLSRGDIVYVFEDDENGYFKCMDTSGLIGRIPLILTLTVTLTLTLIGLIGRIPSNIVQFDETVPKERPMQPGGRTDPLNPKRPLKVPMDPMSSCGSVYGSVF